MERRVATKSSYKDLVVWKRAIDLVPPIYELLRRFPPHENFGLAAQIRRSVVSISANIAEGQGRQHRKEFLQHLSIAKGSLAELNTLLIVAQRLNYIDMDVLKEVERELGKVGRPLSGLIQTIAAKSR